MATHDAEHPQAEREQPHDADLRPRRRARLRGGGRLGEEDDPRVPREGPGRPDAPPRGVGSAEGRALGELRDHAVPLQQARPRSLLPDRSGRAGDGGQRDVLPDRHAVSARRTRHLSEARLRAVRGRGRDRRRLRRAEGAGARRTRRQLSPDRSTSTARGSSTGRRSSAETHRRSPTCASPRRSSSSASSTTTSRPGPTSTWPRWKRRSVTRTPSRPRTCAVTSTT